MATEITLDVVSDENLPLEIASDQENLEVSSVEVVRTSGTTDYRNLTNKPKINNVELNGNQSSADLGIVIPAPQTSGTPAALGVPARGSSTKYAREDHVHPVPTADDVRAVPLPDGAGPGDYIYYDGTEWVAGSVPVTSVNGQTGAVTVEVPEAATDNPSALGPSAVVGNSAKFAKSDHVHPLPSAENVGAIAAPANPSSGNVLKYKNNSWVAEAPDKDVFYAERGVTTIESIVAARVVGKEIIANDDGNYYQLLNLTVNEEENPPVYVASFGAEAFDGLAYNIYTVNADGWSYSSVSNPSINDTYAPFATGTGNGATVSFSDGANGIPLKSCSVNVDFEQSGSGDPSENNIRPITIYHGCEIVVSPSQDSEDGETYQFDFGDNQICAGTFDPPNGTLDETKVCCNLTGNEAWTLSASNGYRRFYRSLSALGWPAIDTDHATEAVSSHFKRKGTSTQTTDTFGVFRISTDGYLVLLDNGNRFADKDELNAWIQGQIANDKPVQFAYVPVEPNSYFITPQSITTYLGQNYVWADTGDISLTYRKDPNSLGGGGGTSDYTYLTNKPSIESVTLSGNKTAADLGLAKLTDIPAVPSGSSATPQALGTAAAGISDNFSRADHVHAMPTAANVGAVATAQGVGHAGEFLVVGSDGNVTTVTMTAWQGGSY